MSKTIKKEWDLSVLYKSPSDPRILSDFSKIEKAYNSFAKKYKNSDKYLKNETALFVALQDYEKLISLGIFKSYYYLELSRYKDSRDPKITATKNLIYQKIQKLNNLVLFFEINLSKIQKPLQTKLLKNKKFAPYHYFLEKIFENSKFVLSEAEEKILSLKSLPANELWVEGVENMQSKKTVEHKGKQIPISEAIYIIKDLPTQKERVDLQSKSMDKLMELGDVAQSEINAIVINKKIDDSLRGFSKPYDATILGYENKEKTILTLVETITENFSLSQRFYGIKKKMLGLKKLTYADRAVSVGKTNKKISFEESYEILQKLFFSMDPKFGEILDYFAHNSRIDTYPRVGKAGGAYCFSERKVPTFVLLNHTDTFESLMTFGHEMGHAIHAEFSKSQPAFYEGHSTATAETASTMFEAFVFYDAFEKLSEDEKIIALHDKIQDDVQTIFRQIACFNFELEMHETIRSKGNMSKEDLASLMNKHMKSYIGDVDLTEKDGYFFVTWGHIRRFFYVYSYAFGQLTSKALHKKYLENKTYMEKIKKFLSAGGSASPEDIFKSIGVDITKPDFWKKGIESIKEDILLLETLVNKKSKK